MPSEIRAVFFDAGNTLIYPRLEVLVEDLRQQGYRATEEDFLAAERAGKAKLDEWLWPQVRQGNVPRTIDHYYWTQYLAALMERIGAPQQDRERLMLRVADGFRQITLWSRVMPETPTYLAALRGKGYFMGVISNSIGTMAEQLGRVGLAPYFDTVLDSAIVGVEKPHPAIFQLAIERAQVAPAEAVFVGDINATDMGGAQLSGLRGVLIDRVGAYSNPDAPRITSLTELDGVLEIMSARAAH